MSTTIAAEFDAIDALAAELAGLATELAGEARLCRSTAVSLVTAVRRGSRGERRRRGRGLGHRPGAPGPADRSARRNPVRGRRLLPGSRRSAGRPGARPAPHPGRPVSAPTLAEVAGWEVPLLRGAVGTLDSVAGGLPAWRAAARPLAGPMAPLLDRVDHLLPAA